LAACRAIPKELTEAAKVDGRQCMRGFWEVPSADVPVSVTEVRIRMIFKLSGRHHHQCDRQGGPGGATDRRDSFSSVEYRDRSKRRLWHDVARVYLRYHHHRDDRFA